MPISLSNILVHSLRMYRVFAVCRTCCTDCLRHKENETKINPSTGTGKENTGNRVGKNGETEEARAESGIGKATVRRGREDWKGRTEG